MDFSLSQEQLMVKQMCRDFAEREIMPRAAEMDRSGEFPYDLWEKITTLGLPGIPIPPEYGGAGGDWLSTIIAIEEVSRGDVSIGISYTVDVTLPINLLYTFGTEEQKQKWLVPMAKGETIGAFGLTEPEAGSDAGATKTQAVLVGNEWVINGTKAFITNAGLRHCSLVIITAVTGKRSTGKREICNFIVPTGTTGYTVGIAYSKMGWRASDTRELLFENCHVPKDNILGEEGKGFGQFLSALQTGRLGVAALSVGLAQACFDAAISYAQQRVQFGQPISKFQAIQFKLADMGLEIELARLITYKAAWLKDQMKEYSLEASYAKLFASEVSKRCADHAVQIHGGYGFIDDFAVSRYWRNVKINEIGEGTSEIQRLLIARHLGL